MFLTLVPQFLDPRQPVAGQILILGTALSALVATWLAGWTAVLAGATRLLDSARAKRVWKRASACVLIVLGLGSAIA